jgi:Ca2+-binding RTX toxin-like protein
MRAHPGLAALVVGVAALACLASAAPSLAAVTCTYSGADHTLSVSAADSFTRLVRAGASLEIDDAHSRIPCTRGHATVTNTDRIQIAHTGLSADVIDLGGGPFAPGFTPEPQGTSEIEIEYLGQTFLNARGTSGPDRLGFSAGGLDLNADGDTDVTGAFTAILLAGRGGNDRIAPEKGYARVTPRRVLLGGAGKDTLIATPDGSVLHGGNGRDRLIGGAGHDNLTGGRGKDLMRGGKGRDLIRAIDGTRDRVICGPGVDRAKVDGIDIVKGCERLIRVKRR